jgi:hypothetical protein
VSSTDLNPAAVSRWPRFERFVTRYSAVTAAVIVMLQFDLLYFSGEFLYPKSVLEKLPAVLQAPVFVVGGLVWVSYLFFAVPCLCLWQVIAGVWLLVHRKERWSGFLWRTVLAILTGAIWLATIGRFEYPGN